MAPVQITESDGTRPNPPVFGSLAYLLLNMPIGIATFTVMVTLLSVGVSTVIIWLGLPVLALAILACRGFARLERRRVHVMLGSYVATPYRPLPAGRSGQWRIRVKDAATWKDMVYMLLLLPVGVTEFALMISFWSVSLWLLFMPVYYGLLPEEVYDWDLVFWSQTIAADSALEALPWAAVGAVLLAVTIMLTKALGSLHVRFARAILGPSRRKLDALASPATAAGVGWSSERVDFRTQLYPGV